MIGNSTSGSLPPGQPEPPAGARRTPSRGSGGSVCGDSAAPAARSDALPERRPHGRWPPARRRGTRARVPLIAIALAAVVRRWSSAAHAFAHSGSSGAEVAELAGREAVIEGCYADIVAALARPEDALIWMDTPVDECILRAQTRGHEPHKWPSAAAQNAFLPTLGPREAVRLIPRDHRTRDSQHLTGPPAVVLAGSRAAAGAGPGPVGLASPSVSAGHKRTDGVRRRGSTERGRGRSRP